MYKKTKVGERLLGFGSSLVPQCVNSCLSTVIQNIIKPVFTDAEVPLDLDKCTNSIPADKTIHISITNNAIETIILNNCSLICL